MDEGEENDNAKFMALIKHPEGCELFKKHLMANYTEQHLCFWQDVQVFRKITNDDEALRTEARKLFNMYVKKSSVKEINITEVLKSHIKDKLDQEPSIEMFADAERTSLDLIKGNFFFQFLQTDAYKNWKANLGKPGKKEGGGCSIM